MRIQYKNWFMLFVLLCVVVAGLYGISGRLAGNREGAENRKEVWAVSKGKSAAAGGTRGTLKLYSISLGDGRGSESAFPAISESR